MHRLPIRPVSRATSIALHRIAGGKLAAEEEQNGRNIHSIASKRSVILNAYQLRCIAAIADDLTGGYAAITAHANLQLREIAAMNAPKILLRLSEAGLTSRGATPTYATCLAAHDITDLALAASPAIATSPAPRRVIVPADDTVRICNADRRVFTSETIPTSGVQTWANTRFPI